MFSKKSTNKHTDGSKPSSSKNASASASSTHGQVSEPRYSFLFAVNELYVNEDPDSGGVKPRTNEHGQWAPPMLKKGFVPPNPGQMYRWRNGVIKPTSGPGPNKHLTKYRCATVFYCNPFVNFLITNCDVTKKDMIGAGFGENCWSTLKFRNNGPLSRVDTLASDEYLAGPSGNWVDGLGLQSYRCRAPNTAWCVGLSGNLAILIALIAFSCGPNELDCLFTNNANNAWDAYQWKGHTYASGRDDGRGLVVTIYLDPKNPTESNKERLNALEWSQGVLLS